MFRQTNLPVLGLGKHSIRVFHQTTISREEDVHLLLMSNEETGKEQAGLKRLVQKCNAFSQRPVILRVAFQTKQTICPSEPAFAQQTYRTELPAEHNPTDVFICTLVSRKSPPPQVRCRYASLRLLVDP